MLLRNTKLQRARRFSALQRAEIAEIKSVSPWSAQRIGFSALQRAEIAEISCVRSCMLLCRCFSALQRAEIAEIDTDSAIYVLGSRLGFSALQRAEIAEIAIHPCTSLYH